MTTPIVIEISRNGNPVGDRHASGQITSVPETPCGPAQPTPPLPKPPHEVHVV